jgi:hypothetical protein
MRILVCGGRKFADRSAIAKALAPYRPSRVLDASEHIFILGGAPGADTLAEEWADVWGVRKRIYPANWELYGSPAAGPIRNQQMLEEGRPDLVIAFPGDRGTANMVRRAKAAGVEVVRVTVSGETVREKQESLLR